MPKVHRMGVGPRGGVVLCVHCPGCNCAHPFEVDVPGSAGWTWNGSLDKPTFAPSLLCNKDTPESRCHSFVADGKMQFLNDCHHALAGQTVELPEWE